MTKRDETETTEAPAPDLLLTTATLLRDHLASIGKGKLCDDLSAALKPHEDAAKAKAEAEQAKEDKAAQKEAEKLEKAHR